MTLRNLIGWKGLTLAAAATFGVVGMIGWLRSPRTQLSPVRRSWCIGLGGFCAGQRPRRPSPVLSRLLRLSVRRLLPAAGPGLLLPVRPAPQSRAQEPVLSNQYYAC